MKRARSLADLPILTAALTFAITPMLFAGGSAELDAEAELRAALIARLSLSEAEYTVVLTTVVTPDIPEEDRIVLGSYVQVLRDMATGLPWRYLDSAERRALAEQRLRREEERLMAAIEARRLSIERNRLESGLADGPIEDTELSSLHEERARLATVGVDDVSVPDRVPVRLLEGEYEFRRVLPTAEGETLQSDENRLFLYLTVEELGADYVFTVRSWLPVLERDREVLRIIASPADIADQLEAYERTLVAELAGRPLAVVNLRAADAEGNALDEARLFMDGRFLGVGRVVEPYLPEGAYTFTARLPDGREVARAVEIGPDDRTSLIVTIADEEPETVFLASEPAGALVYRGAFWQGFTPLPVPRPTEETSYTIAREGYYDSRVVVGPDSPSRIERVLIAADDDWAESVERSRDRFYRSFGAFVVSVGVPILINGVYQNYTGLYPGGVARSDLSQDEQDRLQPQVDALFYGYYVGIGLSAGLFANMIWRLVDYVQTAQGYHTR